MGSMTFHADARPPRLRDRVRPAWTSTIASRPSASRTTDVACAPFAGRLVPFVRLDLTAQLLEEARRCLDLGAKGIKLHPRSQAFALDDERLQPIFALAVERAVPILIHGGRGLPPISEHLEALVVRNEGVQLIIAHAGIADMAGLAGRLGGRPGVFFDTSVWSGLDLLDLYRQVSPEQVLYASDYPWEAAELAARLCQTAKLAGFDDKRCGRCWRKRTANRRGSRAGAALAAEGAELAVQPLTFARIHQYVSWRCRCSGCVSDAIARSGSLSTPARARQRASGGVRTIQERS